MPHNTQPAFEAELQFKRHVKHPSGRSVYLDEHGLWGCDEYGCDSFLGEEDQQSMDKAFEWINTPSNEGHPAEFSH